ncbi:hypothetical protein BE221DRAFT_76719 [Ostreococcus tauri]|uniref:Cytochrome c-553 n=1 Tax=Ostreococcus tauri TaxID=70448 RepID=A0A1Y5IBC8_OSTTA|nr:hypothetical protein BE221DRAFT_76719 [Ostreococcus tauri]
MSAFAVVATSTSRPAQASRAWTSSKTRIKCSPDRSHEPFEASAAPFVALAASAFLIGTSPARAFDGDAAVTFSSKGCVGCHAAGGNVVNGSATLFTRDLERNGLTTKDDVARVIELGKGKMPGYGEACAPKGACTFGARLNAEEIDALATYVLEQAANDWK